MGAFQAGAPAEVLALAWCDSDEEAERRIAEANDDPDCLAQFLHDAESLGEDTSVLCAELLAETETLPEVIRRRLRMVLKP
jgi:hypothetical protein